MVTSRVVPLDTARSRRAWQRRGSNAGTLEIVRRRFLGGPWPAVVALQSEVTVARTRAAQAKSQFGRSRRCILFLAANPGGARRLSLDREAHAIFRELELSEYRECFEFETRWALEPLDLLRELRRLRPAVVHLAGLACSGGLIFRTTDGRARVVTADALGGAFVATGTSVRLVVLGAGCSETLAEVLRAYGDVVVWMGRAIHHDAARSFAMGFYGGIVGREPVAVAYRQGRAAIDLEGSIDGERPQLKVRRGRRRETRPVCVMDRFEVALMRLAGLADPIQVHHAACPDVLANPSSGSPENTSARTTSPSGSALVFFVGSSSS
jgi:hypothetical protein